MSDENNKKEEAEIKDKLVSDETESDIDFEVEPDLESGDLAGAQDKLKKLKEKLRTCQKEKQEYLDGWQKERADFINYKKDEAARAARAASYAREGFLSDLLPVLDSYDLAFANKEAWEKVDKDWRKGVEYIHQQLLKILSDYGVTEIEVQEGSVFDPNLHQPVESVFIDDKSKDHTIAKVLNKGYRTQNTVLRPARVNVFALSSK
ncbi:nucleotide exchange factor GrpE [Candidatus Nomurabacteria bacterium RIFCSPHIGHO2_01_FULL_42_16]|uniref:Protein GrpE n=1 Tax=Candidatus Nomurabacteria bacterium RIFCSPHIGHO2_01_FULL_42_16 TaxID=1801743 RepID=A0A1F6VHN4_9BACT|nr:MAG: nucleotide exchange factor GrpE [Candidatus Nomurabacteria bacterium RIFCSPHIGHO2_01_FULL_42_16]